MYKFRRLLALTMMSLLIAAATDAQSLPQTVSMGSASFAIDEGNSLPHTQNATSFTINGPFAIGEGLGGGFLVSGSPGSYDWSAATGFSLRMLVSASSAIGFSLDFFDESAANVARYRGSTDGLTGAFSDVSLQQQFQNDMSAVFGMQLTFDDAGTFNTTIESVTAVPEPTTWALMIMGAAFLGANLWRRRAVPAARR